jgi:hypothetical protein
MRRVGVRKREGYSGGGGQGQGGRWINGAMATGKVSSLGFWFVGAAVAAVEGWGARGGTSGGCDVAGVPPRRRARLEEAELLVELLG